MKTLEFIGVVISPIVSAIIAWKVATRKKERRKIEPDPLRVRKYSERATEDNCKERYQWAMEAIESVSQANSEEHQRIHERIGGVAKDVHATAIAVGKEIKEMELRLANKDEERSGNLHDRVNDILTAVSEMRGALGAKDKDSRPGI